MKYKYLLACVALLVISAFNLGFVMQAQFSNTNACSLVDNLNVRRGPSVSAPVITQLDKDECVNVVEVVNTDSSSYPRWARTASGYVAVDFVVFKDVEPVFTPEPTNTPTEIPTIAPTPTPEIYDCSGVYTLIYETDNFNLYIEYC